MKYLGIDFGLKKIGLALGDDETGIAFPYGVIPGGADAAVRILDVAKKEGAEAFVSGLPMPVGNHHSDEQLKLTMAFAAELGEVSRLPVHLVDEQFSSAEARRVQKEYGAQAEEDALAAMLILQAYFDESRREANG